MTEPSKHKSGRRRATTGTEPTRAAKQSGGSRVKAPSPVRRSGGSRFAWARTTGGMIGIGVAVLAAALVLRFAVSGDDDSSGQSPVGAALTTYGTDWKTKDGHSYEITVTPVPVLVADASGSGCVPAPGPGRTNLRFTVRIDNAGTEPAPVPVVRFAANLNAAGEIIDSPSFAKASKRIDLSPQANLQDCKKSAEINAGDEQIGPKSAAIFTGLIGGVKTPVDGGLSLIVRYTQADAGAADGIGTADVLVRYPDLSKLS